MYIYIDIDIYLYRYIYIYIYIDIDILYIDIIQHTEPQSDRLKCNDIVYIPLNYHHKTIVNIVQSTPLGSSGPGGGAG